MTVFVYPSSLGGVATLFQIPDAIPLVLCCKAHPFVDPAAAEGHEIATVFVGVGWMVKWAAAASAAP